MAGAIMEKVFDLFRMDPAEDREDDKEEYEVEEVENEEEEQDQEERKLWGRKSGKVVSMPQVQQVKMVISQPTTFEQAATICDLLKQKKSVIVNLEYVNKDVARRIIDVVSGAVHALDGHMQKIYYYLFFIATFNLFN